MQVRKKRFHLLYTLSGVWGFFSYRGPLAVSLLQSSVPIQGSSKIGLLSTKKVGFVTRGLFPLLCSIEEALARMVRQGERTGYFPSLLIWTR